MKKITIQGNNIIENLGEDWGGINNSSSSVDIHGTEVPSKAEWGINRGEIERFIKTQFNKKAGEFYYDADTTKYLIFADINARNLYLTDREEYADLLIGTFDAPANYTAEINMATPSSNVILAGTTGNYIDFTFDVKSRSGSSTGEAVIVTYTFNNSGSVQKVTQVYAAGTSVHFLIDQYLAAGTNSVSVVVTGRNTLASSMAAVNFTVVALELTSDFDFSQPVTVGEYLSIPYSLSGAGVKYLEWYIDGVLQQEVDTITDLKVNRTKNIDTTGMSLGKHSVQTRAYFTNNGTNYYGATLYFDYVVRPVTAWESNVTYILLALILPAPAVSTISVNATQYEELAYKIAVYDSRSRSLALTISDNGTQIQNVTMQPDEIQSLSYTPTTTGNHTLTFTCDGQTASITASVESSGIGIDEVTTDLLLKLSAKGRSNTEVNPALWTYGNITTTFNNFAWNEQSGWSNGALVIPAGASIDIAFAPLGGNPITNGRTIEIDYETANIDNDDANVISLVNSGTNAGLDITASSAKLQSSGGANVNTKYKDGDRVHLAFIINKTTGDNGRLMFIVNNGILERAASFAATDVFQVGDNLHIGSAGCTVKVYSIRIYDKALTADEAFCNYAVDSDNLIEIANNNDILNESTGLIDADKVNAKIPIIIITGDMLPIFDATDKSTTVYVDMEYRNLLDQSKNFTATHVRMRPQGTSSLGYPRKNLRPYTAAKYGCTMYDANGDIIENGLYAFKDGSQPVNCWTLKADYAESSGSHNTGVARIWNDLMYNCQLNGEFPLRTNAQKAAILARYNYDVRTTVDGFPIVVFHRQTESSPLVCLGQYNFNNDKSTEKVFGFTDIPGFDNTNVQCFEFLANESPICLFDDVSEFDTKWDDAFESRYPDTSTPNLVPLKTLATWINACKNNQTKWNTEKEDHFDLPKLAAYYVYLMRFGAVDQPVKNAMITTEDGVHWFFINYDNDTILGIDNISTVLNAWNYDRTTQKVGGAYYYAGHNSVLWNCFEADDECMALVREIDNALYSAGLTYNNMVQMFDNEQCDKWCERIYNDNGAYKYIAPFKEKGSAVLYMLQGSRKSYRRWWLQHRFDLYDAMWATGAFRNRIIRFIAEGAQGGTFTITSAANTFFGYGINSVTQEAGIAVNKDATHDFTITRTLAIGDPVAIYNANNISRIDLSNFAAKLTTLYINQAIGNNGKSALKSLILGDGVTDNVVFTEIGGLNAIVGLEEIDIRNFKAVTNVELETLPNLHIFKASGSGLTSFAPAAGVQLTNVTLPSTLQSIVLDNCNVTALTIDAPAQGSGSNLNTLIFRNVSGTFDVKSLVLDWLDKFTDSQLANCSLTLTDINWTGVTVAQVLKLAQIGEHTLRGRIMLTSLTYEQYQQIIEAFGNNVFDPNGSFIIDAPNGIYFSAPASLTEGHTVTLDAVAFPIGANPIVYHLYDNGTEINPVEGIATLGSITLNVNTGELSVGTINHDFTIGLRAVSGTSVSDILTCSILDITTIGGFTIQGTQTYTSPGNYELSLIPNTQNYNVAIQSIAVQAQFMSELFSFTYDTTNLKIGVSVSAIPVTTELQYCDIIVTDVLGNVFRQDNVEFTIQVIRPTDFTISGAETILSKGAYQYNITNVLPANHNKDIASIAVTVAPSQGVVISNPTSTGFNLVVTSMPECTTDIVLTVVATLDNNTTLTRTKTVKIKVVSNIDILDELGVAIQHKNGTFYSAIEWTNGGFANADANGVAVSDGTTRIVTKFMNNVNKAMKAESFCNAYIFADGSAGRFPLFSELQIIADVYNAFRECLIAIGNVSSRETDYGAFCHNGSSDGKIILSSGQWDGPSTWSGEYPVCTPRAISLNKPVDLGLPSGRLWSNVNLGAASIEDTGLYYQWGNLDGHDETDGYNFSTTHYAKTPGSQIATKLPLANDAANDTLGGYWRMPTRDDFAELFNNTYTTRVWTTVNEVGGWRITSKTNGNSIFIPVAGYIDNSGFHNKTTNGYYWSSDSYNNTAGMGILLTFTKANVTWNGGYAVGNLGQTIRPVLDPPVLSGDSEVFVGNYNYTIEKLDNIASIAASVSTPSSGTIAVTTSGTTTVVLNVSVKPSQDEDITITVVATLTNGDTVTLTKIVTLLTSLIIMTTESNAPVLGICYAQGWCADSTKMTADEAAAVTDIGTAFKSNSHITHFEEFEYFTDVTSIGQSAFSGCHGLTSITIPQNVTSIGQSAFQECTSLTSITIPNSVSNIDNEAFRNCSSLTSISVESGNTKYDSRDNCNAIIESSSNTLILGCKNTILPNSVTSIGDYAFYNCTGLTSITIGSGVTSIGKGAFTDCTGLTSVTIPNSVTSIGEHAFSYCTGLTSITIPNSVTSIGLSAFQNCSGLTSINISNRMTSISNSAFESCSKLESVSIPASVTSIGNYAFSSCTSLTSITIPNSVTSIGQSAFQNCSGLTSITIPDSVTTIKQLAFYYCSNLASITIGSGVTYIGDNAFLCCSGLTSVTIPDSIMIIGKGIFLECTSLTSVTISSSVTSIGNSAFVNCTKLGIINCLRETAPMVQSTTFTAVGTDSSVTTKELNVPANATGYDTGEWKSQLLDKGYTLNKVL